MDGPGLMPLPGESRRVEQPETLSGSLVGPIVALFIGRKNQPFGNHERSSMALDFAKAKVVGPRGNDNVQRCPKVIVRPPRIGMVTKVEDSPMIKDVLAVSTDLKKSDVDTGGIEDGSKFCPIVALNGTVNREGPIIGVTESPPGATAGPSEVRMAVWVDTSPVGPGDDPAVAENVVVSVKRGSRGLDPPNFLELRRIVDRRETGNEGVKLRSLNHDASVAGARVPPGRVNGSRFKKGFSTRTPTRAGPIKMGMVFND